MAGKFSVGAIWDSLDGKRSVPVEASNARFVYYQNIDTGRHSRIDRLNLLKRYNWRGDL